MPRVRLPSIARPTLGQRRHFQSSSIRNSQIQQNAVIFSGIQPTGIPHLGNYLGALQQWVKLQDEAAPETKLLYSIVDLHAITVKQDPTLLRQMRKEMLVALLAVGLDPKRCTLFCQSAVPAHSELMWILSCNASTGYLSRMTQWKSKLSLPENTSMLDSATKAKLKLGLFSYPVLQAADVLVHRATHVPVGSDQSQHLEFARECAIGFNHLYGPVLTTPETILSPAKRVMSLTQPHQKMSKSHENPKSRILITDSRDTIFQKIKVALTDSIEGDITYDPANRPGVSNLLEIMAYLQASQASSSSTATKAQTPADLAEMHKNTSLRTLKETAAATIDEHLRPVRERFEEIMHAKGEKWLAQIEEEGAEKATESARGTMKLVHEAIGF